MKSFPPRTPRPDVFALSPAQHMADYVPYNIEAEKGVLGGIVLDNERILEVVPILEVRDFFRDSHQVIYAAIRDLFDAGQPVDPITLVEEIERRGQLAAVGGHQGLGEILRNVPVSANALYYAQIVRANAVKRDLMETAQQTLADIRSKDFTAEALIQRAEEAVFALGQGRVAHPTVTASAAIAEAMARIEERGRGVVTGIRTGYHELDDTTDGFQPGQMIVLAARPSMGKTALALNILEHVALGERAPSLIVSLEMNRREVGERLIVARAGIANYKLKDPGARLGRDEYQRLVDATEEYRDAPLEIDDSPAESILAVVSRARWQRARKRIVILVIDYLQLIDHPREGGQSNRQEEVARISRRIKQLARELSIPVLVLSQLNREVEKRGDNRPRMADLRESGAIEQDADVIMLLHRPEYYDPNDQPGLAELIIAKNRNGATRTIKLNFDKPTMRFSDLPDAAALPHF